MTSSWSPTFSPAYRASFVARAVAAERKRIVAILSLPGATRAAAPAAQHCIATGIDQVHAAHVLASFRPAPSTLRKEQFAAAMAAVGNPLVKAGEAPDDEDANSPGAIQASWDHAMRTAAAKHSTSQPGVRR